MPCLSTNRPHRFAARFACHSAAKRRNLLLFVSIVLALSFAPAAHAQLSLTGAVDLALRSNPRVKGAQDDLDKAHAQLAEVRDAYIPSVSAGASLGQSYGYSAQPPTLATLNGGSLAYSSAQFSYIRSARAGINAAQLALSDVREAVAQDTALAFIALDHDQQRDQALNQQFGYANNLVTIVQQRLDAGQDTAIGLTQAQLTQAQLHLATLKAQDDVDVDREHLAHLIGLPSTSLRTDGNFPTNPISFDTPTGTPAYAYAVAAAFATAEARKQQAHGDSHFLFRPQINFVAQYNRYASFTESFAALQRLDSNGQTTLRADEGAFGILINLPLFDRARTARAQESTAVAARAFHDAQAAQIEALDGQSRLRHSIDVLQAQADVATLQQQLAQQQLDVTHLQQQQSGNPDGPQVTPKDEQNAHIAERDKYLAVIDAGFQLRQAEIQLLRQTGGLEEWLKSTIQTPVPNTPTRKP